VKRPRKTGLRVSTPRPRPVVVVKKRNLDRNPCRERGHDKNELFSWTSAISQKYKPTAEAMLESIRYEILSKPEKFPIPDLGQVQHVCVHQKLTPAVVRSHTPVGTLATSITSMSTGVTTKHPQTVRAWTSAQHPRILDCCTIQRKQPASSLAAGTSAPTHTWPSRVSARTADCRTDVS